MKIFFGTEISNQKSHEWFLEFAIEINEDARHLRWNFFEFLELFDFKFKRVRSIFKVTM
jgi:hypothetical protein